MTVYVIVQTTLFDLLGCSHTQPCIQGVVQGKAKAVQVCFGIMAESSLVWERVGSLMWRSGDHRLTATAHKVQYLKESKS